MNILGVKDGVMSEHTQENWITRKMLNIACKLDSKVKQAISTISGVKHAGMLTLEKVLHDLKIGGLQVKTVLANQINKINPTCSRRNVIYNASAVTLLVLWSVGYLGTVCLAAFSSFGMVVGISTSNSLFTTPVVKRSRRSHGDITCEGDTDALPDYGTTLPLPSSGYTGATKQVKRNLLTALTGASLVTEGESTSSQALVVRSNTMLSNVAAKAEEYIDYETMFFGLVVINVILMLLLVVFMIIIPWCRKSLCRRPATASTDVGIQANRGCCATCQRPRCPPETRVFFDPAIAKKPNSRVHIYPECSMGSLYMYEQRQLCGHCINRYNKKVL